MSWLEANQPSLHEDVRLLLDDPSTSIDGRTSTTDGDHGRIETREAVVVHLRHRGVPAPHGDVGYLVEAPSGRFLRPFPSGIGSMASLPSMNNRRQRLVE